MPIRTEDYRPYTKEHKGRGYRIFRIFSNTMSSLVRNKWTIIVMSFSFLFLFFSMLEIVFSAPIEEAESDITEDLFSKVYFDIITIDRNDLDIVAPLNSTFEVSYSVKNVGSNGTTPLCLMLLPNGYWEAEYDMVPGALGPGESLQLDVLITVPSTWQNFSYVPKRSPIDEKTDDGENGEIVEPRSKEQAFYTSEGMDQILPGGSYGLDLSSISSPYDLFPEAEVYQSVFSRPIMLVVMPGDIDLELSVKDSPNPLDPRISSLASMVSLDPSECSLSPERLISARTPSLEMRLKGDEGPNRKSMTSQDYEELTLVIRNNGTETLRFRVEALIMPIADPSMYVEIWSPEGFGPEADRGLAPGEEMVFIISISSGYYQMKMPYNVLIVGTEFSDQYYREVTVEQVIIEITGPPKGVSLEDKLFRTFWGGGFNYERFLWLILLTAVCGSGLIANDLRNNTLTLYLSRPITWVDYAAGKFLGLAATLSIITLIPAALVFITRMAFVNEPFSFVLGYLWLLGGMLLAYMVAIILFTSIAMALSSMTKRGIFAGVGIFGFFIFTPLVSDILADIFDSDVVKLLNINLMMKNLIKPLFGIPYNESTMGFGFEFVVLVCTAVLLASWAVIYLKFNNREVVK
ncbi:MAG: ABC transporter permease subunit [Candidatus Thermoplasmatota archaeon]|nr:ABC transporter permease subunit [Candidatus Thermoplasmatota archaeon]